MAYIKKADVMADIEPLARECQWTMEDLMDLTGYDVQQIRAAWQEIKRTNTSGLVIGVDPDSWVYCMTDDPEVVERVRGNRAGDMLSRLATIDPAIYEPAYQSGQITARMYRALKIAHDEMVDMTERAGVQSQKAVKKSLKAKATVVGGP